VAVRANSEVSAIERDMMQHCKARIFAMWNSEIYHMDVAKKYVQLSEALMDFKEYTLASLKG
jgi:hypothetical protein